MNGFFDVAKAEELLATYNSERKKSAKVKLLKELISWQIFFGETPIVGVKICLEHRYQKRTIYSVLTDLGFSNIRMKNITEYEYMSGAKIKSVTELIFS